MTVSHNMNKSLTIETIQPSAAHMVESLEKSVASSLLHLEAIQMTKTILSGYAQVYFSKQRLPGLLFCLATFAVPVIGAAGLLCMLLSILFARILGFSRGNDDSVFFAYNGLLTALALCTTYTVNLSCLVLLVLAMFFCVLVSSACRTLFEKYMFVPVLSLPFIITTWIVMAAGRRFSGLMYTTTPFEIDLLNGVFPQSLEILFRSLGAAFFQLSIPSGILVALGLLISSRHAFIVASAGIFLTGTLYMAAGGQSSDLNGQWIGFNFALTAIAVGGMFVVPGIDSYGLAFIGALLSALVAAGALMLFEPLGLPVLALPFVFTTLMIIYPLRNRISQRWLTCITSPKDSPEANLKHHKNQRARFVSDETPALYLPVSGEWTVTQGFEGDKTHMGPWAHALDFEVMDQRGNTFQNRGDQLTDYYAWNMPVFAPGDGVVTRVIHHIDDNRVGQVNTKNNWGNTVIIWHYGLVYSSISHLAKDSVCVKEGETIKKGKVIGKVGNSGRSPFPHLHIQVQLSPELGAHTLPFKILNYCSTEKNDFHYHICGVPQNRQRVIAVQSETAMMESASFPIGGQWEYDVCSGDRSWKETWVSDIDFIGNRFLRCKETNATLRFFMNTHVLVLLDYKGPSNTALEWLFLGAHCIPYTRQSIQRCEKMPAERLLDPIKRLVFDSVEPIGELASLSASIHQTPKGTGLLELNTRLSLNEKFFSSGVRTWGIQTTFARHKGLMALQATSSGKTVLQAMQRGDS